MATLRDASSGTWTRSGEGKQPRMSLRCVFLGVCVFLFWVLFHFGSCVSLFFFLLFCGVCLSSETETTVAGYFFFWYREYALWYKRARDLFNRRKSHPQPTACTPPSRPSSAWPRSSSRTTSHRHIKHPRTFIHNHAAPRGLGQLKNERAEGERDTLRSNHGPYRITSPTPRTPGHAPTD